VWKAARVAGERMIREGWRVGEGEERRMAGGRG